MILCPPSNDRVEHENESSRRQRLVLLDDFPDLFQVCMHVLLCWFDQQLVLLSCFVLASVFTEEIEPVLTMGDTGFLAERSNPRSFIKASMRGLTSCSSSSFDAAVTMKSSAYRTKLTFAAIPFPVVFGKFTLNILSIPSSVIFAITGEIMSPCGVPSSVG